MTYVCIGVLRHDAEHISIQWTVVFVKWWFAPSAWMETPLGTVHVVCQYGYARHTLKLTPQE